MSFMPLESVLSQSSHQEAVPVHIREAAEMERRPGPSHFDNRSRELLSAVATNDAEFLRHLLEQGANANYADPRSGMTLLMMAQHPDLIRMLLAHGADPSALDHDGATALHHAVMGSRALEIIPLLVNQGADVNARDDNGVSVLMQAVMNDKPELVGLMIDLGADLRIRTKDGQTAQDWAQDLGFADIAEMLENAATKR